jgi:CRISPR-associated protein (TIGR03986 family)
MPTIKAPFNFVPVSDKVFFPDWADKISHDIPFSDGESGVIELKITACSPIFVRNGHTKEQATNADDSYKSFSKVDDRYFIPATSIKGAIRNVLEIISYSKMSHIDNRRYSLRDLQLKNDYLNFFQNSEVHCGWMKKSGNTITITDHGIPKRISHKELDKKWGTKFSETFKNENLLKEDKKRTALYKILLSENKSKEIQYDEFKMNSVNPVDKRIIAKPNTDGKYYGTVVLTGQPSARKDKILNPDKTVKRKGSGKCYEFVFPKNSSGVIAEMDAYENEIYKDFCFIYKDSDDWQYWKKKMDKGENVPVFFSLANNKLVHFGLSYLYKLPYSNRIKDCLPDKHKSSKWDLSECIFGTTGKDNSLKGRVQFSHAFLEDGEIEEEEFKAYMGSPRSSYYPIYLQQEGNNGYMSNSFITMMSSKARLKGWKRYPVRDEPMKFFTPEGQDDNVNLFIPIKKGAEFRCLIRFHNLRTFEIGALLNSICFNNKGFHSIGFAKPYGYGKVKMDVALINNATKCTIKDYISAFISFMQNQYPDYTKSKELRELNLMSTSQKTKSPLEYMKLSEFVDCKRQKRNKMKELEQTGEYLEYYSNLVVAENRNENTSATDVAKAIVTFVSGPVIKAKLLEGKDLNTKILKVDGKRPKEGDKIIVKIIRKGSNIDYFILQSIIK